MQTFLFETRAGPGAVMPETILDCLPFSPQPMSQWDNDTDLFEFLRELHAGTGFRSYADYIYDRGLSQLQKWIQLFAEAALEALPAPGAVVQSVEVPDLGDEPLFALLQASFASLEGVSRRSCAADSLLFDPPGFLKVEIR